MRLGVVVASVVALAVVGGCSSGGSLDEQGVARAMEWDAPNAERVACTELLAEWSDGAAGSPLACWRFLGPRGIENDVAAQFASFASTVGADALEAKCLGRAEDAGGRVESCHAVWKTPDGYLTLASSINIEGMMAAMDSPNATDLVHEITVWESTSDPRDETWRELYAIPVP